MKIEIKCDGCGKFLEILDAEISNARFFLTVEKCKLCQAINIERGADCISQLLTGGETKFEFPSEQEKTDD